MTVVTGSIPPNKSDLIRFYAAFEFKTGSNFLYLAWERTNVLGNANMDFEINQQATSGFTGSTTGPITLNRQPGDLLVTYDFANGGGRPILGLNRWLVSASSPSVTGFTPNVCLSANSFPCWGDHVTLNAGDSEGAVNNLDAVTDPIPPGNPRSVPALTFGETAINLTAAGVFQPTVCNALGSIYLKSRASSSFTSEVKDFVAPVPVNIINCGRVTIIKHTDPSGINQAFNYTSGLSGTCSPDTTPGAFTLNDGSASTNTEDCVDVPANSYTVVEGSDPDGFTLESLTCTATGTGSSGSQDGANAKQANITLTPGGHVTCTYVNKVGAILVTKTAKNHNLGDGLQHPLAGVTFSVDGVSKTTGANGQACFDGLTIGTTHSVTETSAPTGYAIDTTSKNVTVSGAATCANGTPTGVSFTDTPLTDISASATSEVSGVTNSTIVCKDSNGTVVGSAAPGDPVTASAVGLKPGTYTCTIVVDP